MTQSAIDQPVTTIFNIPAVILLLGCFCIHDVFFFSEAISCLKRYYAKKHNNNNQKAPDSF